MKAREQEYYNTLIAVQAAQAEEAAALEEDAESEPASEPAAQTDKPIEDESEQPANPEGVPETDQPKDDAGADTQVDPVAETQVEAGCSQRF